MERNIYLQLVIQMCIGYKTTFYSIIMERHYDDHIIMITIIIITHCSIHLINTILVHPYISSIKITV